MASSLGKDLFSSQIKVEELWPGFIDALIEYGSWLNSVLNGDST